MLSQMGWKMPSMYHLKIFAWALLGGMIVLINFLGHLNYVDELPFGATSLALSQVAIRVQIYNQIALGN
jgi:hypothetical protein